METLSHSLILPLVGLFLLICATAFVSWFFIPALRLLGILKSVLAELRKLKSADNSQIGAIFGKDEALRHLWSEFSETLHKQTESDAGVQRVSQIWATQPSDTFFNSQLVVDGRIRVEFFKHLPGVFTGLGIIGTFSGLIVGLGNFAASLDAPVDGTSATKSAVAVAGLLTEVKTAFFVSATAIFLAMLATVFEKLFITSLYRYTEEIAHALDARFEMWNGEEHFERMVRASEGSSTHAKQLKDALVNELGVILRDISQHQIVASSKSQEDLGNRIAKSIADGLAEPLAEISGTVKAASGEQSTGAIRILQDAMASFSQQVSDLFGGQLKGIAALNNGASQNMAEVVQTLNKLVAGIESAAKRSSESMGEEVALALVRMEQHQQASNEQSAAFISQLRTLVSESHLDTTTKMQASLTLIGQNVSSMVESLRLANEQSLVEHGKREGQIAQRTVSAVEQMGGSVEASTRQVAEAAAAMQSAVAEISQVTMLAIDRMQLGAETLNHASTKFADAGSGVTSVMGQVATVSGKLSELTGALTTSADAMQATVSDYKNQRQAIVSLLGELNAAVETARRDVALTADMVSRIEISSQKLGETQAQVSEYMDGVGDVLVEAQQKFADATVKTLDRVNQEFHQKLSAAVQLLAATISELDATLATSGTKR